MRAFGISIALAGWRALIGTSFQLGAKTTFLVFGSPDPVEDGRFEARDRRADDRCR